jgi:hypothetical protein
LLWPIGRELGRRFQVQAKLPAMTNIIPMKPNPQHYGQH